MNTTTTKNKENKKDLKLIIVHVETEKVKHLIIMLIIIEGEYIET